MAAIREDRFAYEEAEALLDQYAKEARTAQFRRAYKKLKFMISAYAYCDFLAVGMPKEVALSYAWEDAEMAFLGHGEMCITGPIKQMWFYQNQAEVPLFKSAVEEAFQAASAATGDQVPRRYNEQWRRRPVRTLDEGFNLPLALPMSGVKLREWTMDGGEDVEWEDEGFWLQQEDEILQVQPEPYRKKKEPAMSAASHLRVVPTEEEGGV